LVKGIGRMDARVGAVRDESGLRSRRGALPLHLRVEGGVNHSWSSSENSVSGDELADLWEVENCCARIGVGTLCAGCTCGHFRLS